MISMVTKTKLLEKTFTPIKGLQAQGCTSYYLTKENSFYGISVEHSSGQQILSHTQNNISTNKESVTNILTFLYENAIPVETIDDIIVELLQKIN